MLIINLTYKSRDTSYCRANKIKEWKRVCLYYFENNCIRLIYIAIKSETHYKFKNTIIMTFH